jgi:hypothetical protein
MTPVVRRLGRVLCIAWVAACTRTEAPGTGTLTPDPAFPRVIERLSEPGGYFPSDNLISNETAYLHVFSELRSIGTSGGAYVGVGPDQNFTYIAEVRPQVAFMIDIRRDNMLQHLLFKALFEQARTRVEYLALLLGHELPDDQDQWRDAPIGDLVALFDSLPRNADAFQTAAENVRRAVLRYGIPIDENDLETIRQIHLQFHTRGLDIRYSFSSRHPNWRRLLTESDLEGNQRNYLASEERFRFIKEMQRKNLIVPVVGDLAGPHALASIGREISARGLKVSVFYVSNVEQYLFRDGSFPRFARTVESLPRDRRSVMIRSYFGRGFGTPQNLYGHNSVQLIETVDDFVAEFAAGYYRRYEDLVRRNHMLAPH